MGICQFGLSEAKVGNSDFGLAYNPMGLKVTYNA